MSNVISQLAYDRWRSRRHVGDARPVCRVFLRQGFVDRRYNPWHGQGRLGYYINGSPRPWQGYWIPTTPYFEVPNINSVEISQGFDNNGIATAHLTMENILMESVEGIGGLFHWITRGYFAPFRGFHSGERPPQIDPNGRGPILGNEWFQLLDRDAQITIWQGYGNDELGLSRTFTGLIDEVELSSKPDRIDLSCRDFGKLLADQYVFGWVKDKAVKDPVVFADRRGADDTKKVGTPNHASSIEPGFPIRFIGDKTDKTAWLSAPHFGREVTEWASMKVPAGRYEDVLVYPAFNNMEMFISVYGRHRVSGKKQLKPQVDGVDHPIGWLDVGNGNVPPDPYGPESPPWILHVKNTAYKSRTYRLGHVLELGSDSIIRISFRHLGESHVNANHFHQPIHRAGIKRAVAIKRSETKKAVKGKWILVDDITEVVKACLVWAGFKEWDLESTGISLSTPLIVNRQNKLIDVVAKMAELVGFIFFMGPPDDANVGDNSNNDLGTPTFKSTNLIDPPGEVDEVRDTDLITGIKVHLTDEPMAHTIRVRGKLAAKNKGGVLYGGGATPGSNSDRRIMAYYMTPWGQNDPHIQYGHDAWIIKQVVHSENQLQSEYECKIACILIAMKQLLMAEAAVVEIPGMPGFGVDDLLSIVDTGTAITSRIWIAQRTSTFTSGKSAKWIDSIQGSLMDSPNMIAVRDDYHNATWAKLQEDIAADLRKRKRNRITGEHEGIRN